MASSADHGFIGVDVGGTKVAAAHVVGARTDRPVEIPTHRKSAIEVVGDIERAVEEVMAQSGTPAAIGVGVPSQIDRASGAVLSSVNIALAGVTLPVELRERLGVPVFVDNDANCAALAEARLSGPPAARHLVMYTLGTGVGGGVVIDGRIFRGATGLGAELGHVVLQADGPECPGDCPNHGCVEAFCSGTALERDAAAFAQANPGSALHRMAADSGGRIRGVQVVAAAREGDADCRALLARLGVWLGVAIAGAINTFEPERIVIGGGLCAAADLFFDEARREATARALPPLARRVRLSIARAGADAGVIGAALLAEQELTARAGGVGPGAEKPEPTASRAGEQR